MACPVRQIVKMETWVFLRAVNESISSRSLLVQKISEYIRRYKVSLKHSSRDERGDTSTGLQRPDSRNHAAMRVYGWYADKIGRSNVFY